MLYLIRSFGRNNKSSLKIGFSDDYKKRLDSYRIHNPFSEVITTREGDEILETKLHLYLSKYKEDFLNEWFKDLPEIITLFHQNIPKIDKFVWKNRQDLFSVEDFKPTGNKIKKKIFEDLRIFGGKLQEIDIQWKTIFNKNAIKNIKKSIEDLDFL